MLRSIVSTGVASRTLNKARQLVCAIFNYAMRSSTYGLATNPAQRADRRREPDAAPLAFYSPEQIEALSRANDAVAYVPAGRGRKQLPLPVCSFRPADLSDSFPSLLILSAIVAHNLDPEPEHKLRGFRAERVRIGRCSMPAESAEQVSSRGSS